MQNTLCDGTDVRKDSSRKHRHFLWLRRSTVAGNLWVRYGLAASLAMSILLTKGSPQPVLSSGVEPSPETHGAPSPTPVQVTPPPEGVATSLPYPDHSQGKSGPLREAELWTQPAHWLPPFAGSILVWVAGSITLLVVATLFFRFVQRRRRRAYSPPPMPSVPFLKSSDGSLYFRLNGLDGNGLIIGRGRRGVDLRIGESTPHVDTVSNRHARIYFNITYGNVIIEDLDSTNGIFVNGRQAPRKNLLKDDWVIGLGNVTLTFHDGESDTGPLN